MRNHWPVIVYLLFYTIIFGVKLFQNPFPFFDWDESIYAQVGGEMVNNWSIIPLWQGQAWLDKPPLVPLFYGVVIKLTPFLLPEVSSRLSTLFLSTIALGLLYKLYFKVIKESWLTTLIIIATSLTSIFLQRAQVLNVDIFLLIGWLGYMVFYKRFWVSLLFLSCAVYSKSLIGFYPIGIMGLFYIYEYMSKKISLKEFFSQIKLLIIQMSILGLWHIAMYIAYGQPFLYQHFYESHVKRVTASIESHFGKRTFYIDLLYEQYGKYAFISIVGFIVLITQWFRKKLSDTHLLFALFLFPWFLFLNATKTKIFWYGHPYLGQFALLMLYPLILLKRFRLLYMSVILVAIGMVLQFYFVQQTVLDDFYSSNDPHHILAKEASATCEKLYMMIEPEGREAAQTLESMDLLITTSKWWGNHPSMVYYFDGDLSFIYTLEELDILKTSLSAGSCIAVHQNDEEVISKLTSFTIDQSYDPYFLYIASN
ncbi:MAG: hypothetical protein O3B87_05355 [bacterium]|nr:hypothetical protein [bacterium]